MKKIKATLIDKVSGQEKEFFQDFDDDYPDDVIDYMWKDGNYSCDCNRYDIFFPDDGVNFPCSIEDDERFKLVSLETIN